MTKFLLILGTIKEAIGVFKLIANMYKKYQHNKIDKHYEAKRSRIEDIVSKIDVESKKEESDDAVLRDLHRRLRNIGA